MKKQKRITCPYCGAHAVLQKGSFVYGDRAKEEQVVEGMQAEEHDHDDEHDDGDSDKRGQDHRTEHIHVYLIAGNDIFAGDLI